MSGRARRSWAAIRANPCGVLLVAQLLGIVLYAFLEVSPSDDLGRLVLSLFGMVVLVLALSVVRASPTWTWLGVLIGVPTALLTIVDGVAGGTQPWHFWSDVSHVAFYAYTLVGLLLYMFDDENVSLDEIFAIGATFTVAMWLFTYLYSIVQTLVPGSFTAGINPDDPRTWMELLFLSCTTMTSTGLSDVIPLKPHARATVMLQQIAGMLYLAVVVARLVGLTIARRRPDQLSEAR